MKSIYRVLAVGLCLALAAPGILSAQAPESSEQMAEKVKELEKLLIELKAEMAEMKKNAAAPVPVPETAAAQPNAAAPVQALKPIGGNVLLANLGAPSSLPATPALAEPQQAVASDTPADTKTSVASLLGPTSVQGYLESYYNWNFNNPASQANGLYSFNQFGNQFGLGLVQLQVDKAPSPESRTGYRVSVGFGQAMTGLSILDPGETSGVGSGGLGFAQYLMEGYFSYLPTDKLQIDAGKFATPVGVELIPAWSNWNFSRGVTYSWTNPYFHFGMRAKYTINDKVAVTGFLLNGWNNIMDTNSGKTYAGQLSLTPSKKVSITQTYMGGPEGAGNNADWRHLTDTILTISPTSKLSLIANVIYWRGDRMAGIVDPTWVSSTAGYLRYAATDKTAFATRYEYLNDPYGFATAGGQIFGSGPLGARVHEFTGTIERKLANNIITRWEFRRDMSNLPFFEKGAGNPVTAQNTATIGLMYTFDSREAK